MLSAGLRNLEDWRDESLFRLLRCSQAKLIGFGRRVPTDCCAFSCPLTHSLNEIDAS